MTPFTDLLARLAPDAAAQHIDLPEDWLQGRTTYGGLTAALCLQSVLNTVPDLPPLRSAQFAFLGPATGRLSLRPQTLRQGKSATFVAVDAEGEAGVAARAMLCFAAARPSQFDHRDVTPPDASHWDACPDFFGTAARPNFTRHFETRLADMSGQRGGSPALTVWARHVDGKAGGAFAALAALGDTLPPPALAVAATRFPISTMTWSFDVLDDAPDSASGWWLLHSKAESIVHGYSSQIMTLWNDIGQPVLRGRQTVAIFDAKPAAG